MAVKTLGFILIVTLIDVATSAPKCVSQHNGRKVVFHGAENWALDGYTYAKVNGTTRVRCGRECSMDPKCLSFNFCIDEKLCELNNAAYRISPNLRKSNGSIYFDGDRQTPLLSLSDDASYPHAASCKMLFNAGYNSSGMYTIYPCGKHCRAMQVFCDMTSDGGGWTVFLRRQDGSVDFYRNWTDYQAGFGDLSGEFWLGNDNLVTLTSNDSRGTWELRVDLEDWENNTAWTKYTNFKVTGELYTLNIGDYDTESTAGNALADQVGCSFSTKDQDNDPYQGSHCARVMQGGFWYWMCCYAHLTGPYHTNPYIPQYVGIVWNHWKGAGYSLKKASMKIREKTAS